MTRWDWYQSTVLVSDPQDSGLVDVLLKHWPLSDWAPARNQNGYLYGGQIIRGDRTLCLVCWGGNTGVNCKSSSDESPVLAEALREFGKPHLPTRVDSCIDWQNPDLFDSLSGALIKFAQDNRLTINQQGDWIRGEARTLYVGSKDSPVRLVVYEKGYEQGLDAPKDWVRMEVRIRPKREHRSAVALWEPDQAFQASWVPDALQCLGWSDLRKLSVGTVWKRSDAERARYALIKQYGSTLASWADELGSWEILAAELGRLVGSGSKSSGVVLHPHFGATNCTTDGQNGSVNLDSASGRLGATTVSDDA